MMGLLSLQELNDMRAHTLMETLNIVFMASDENTLSAEMSVTPKTHQPHGALHGGATAALAESVGSALSYSHVDRSTQVPIGIEINTNHVKAISEGIVRATASFLHKGSSIHVVDIRIHDQKGHLIAVSRLTNKIITK